MTKSTDLTTDANIVLIERVYEAFDAQDVGALPTLFAEDVEIYQSSELPWGGEFRGLAGAAQFFGTLLTHIDTRITRSMLIASGDHVVEVGRTKGVVRATGNAVDVAEVHVWTVRADQVVRMEAYVHHPDMLTALNVPS